MSLRVSPLILSLLLPFCLASNADALTGREIMEKADKKNQAKDESTTRVMEIMNEKGQVRKRKMVTYFKAGKGDDDKVLVRFLAPPEHRGVSLLTLESGASDEQWLYLPQNKKTKRIAGASKADSFMGSNFSNYDMRTEDLQGHKYKLLGEATLSKRAFYKVEATPKSDEVKKSTGYARRVLYIDKDRWTIARVDFFDTKNKALKMLRASDWKQVKGLWRASKIEIRSQVNKTRTRLLPAERKVNEGLPDSRFTKRSLKKI